MLSTSLQPCLPRITSRSWGVDPLVRLRDPSEPLELADRFPGPRGPRGDLTAAITKSLHPPQMDSTTPISVEGECMKWRQSSGMLTKTNVTRSVAL
ncbi:unnamed protein product [Arctogadus glacialis]